MAEPAPARRVKLFTGVIFSDPELLEALEWELETRFGSIDARSRTYDFDVTDYYGEEMGPDLKRAFYSFADLIDPAAIVDIKLASDEIERGFARAGRRRLNIDPGYIDFYKLVLASNKFLGQKIYLGKGVYADPTLYYDRGWKPYEWGFPDFKSGRYDEFLAGVRSAYKEQIRSLDEAGADSGG